jgi:hypothetical protein
MMEMREKQKSGSSDAFAHDFGGVAKGLVAFPENLVRARVGLADLLRHMWIAEKLCGQTLV